MLVNIICANANIRAHREYVNPRPTLTSLLTLLQLLDIRVGPGAAIISSDVKRIHLNFARKMNDGHMGPR
jgi:hypothetical protein